LAHGVNIEKIFTQINFRPNNFLNGFIFNEERINNNTKDSITWYCMFKFGM